jgi:hypothetical protein
LILRNEGGLFGSREIRKFNLLLSLIQCIIEKYILETIITSYLKDKIHANNFSFKHRRKISFEFSNFKDNQERYF